MSLFKSLTELRNDGVAVADPLADLIVPPVVASGPWHAAQTNPRNEVKALHGFAALGWTTFLPFGWSWSRPRHAPGDKHVMRRRPGMPGYVFLVAPADDRGDSRISEASSVEGVRRVISANGAPLTILQTAIERMMSAEAKGVFDFNKEPPRGKLWDLKSGDQVKIVRGPFDGFLCTVIRHSTASAVELRDNVFGSKIKATLDLLVPVDL